MQSSSTPVASTPVLDAGAEEAARFRHVSGEQQRVPQRLACSVSHRSPRTEDVDTAPTLALSSFLPSRPSGAWNALVPDGKPPRALTLLMPPPVAMSSEPPSYLPLPPLVNWSADGYATDADYRHPVYRWPDGEKRIRCDVWEGSSHGWSALGPIGGRLQAIREPDAEPERLVPRRCPLYPVLVALVVTQLGKKQRMGDDAYPLANSRGTSLSDARRQTLPIYRHLAVVIRRPPPLWPTT
ncbi:hypothetical protein C8F01DRAFT_1262452 [Mycena amicta]|nr:hypothetical protein C8F01DRAFT_1262452 [Mycena amicta]